MNESLQSYFKTHQIQPSEQSVLFKLVYHSAKIALCSFMHRYVVLLLFHSTFVLHMRTFFKTYGKSLMVNKNLDVPLSYINAIEQYVLFITNLEELSNTLDWLAIQEFDNTGKYIIVCYSSDFNDCNVERMLKQCWSHKIVNLVYLTTNKNFSDVEYFTIEPYQESNCDNSDPINIYVSDIEECADYFPKKCFNLHLCPIVASTFVQLPYMNFTEEGKPFGVNGDLLVLIAEDLNASLKIITPRKGYGWGSKKDNGSWSGSFGDIHDGYANFSMTSAAASLDRVEAFQISRDYSSIKLVWVTCPTELRPAWEKLVRPFDASMNFALFGIFLCITVFNIFINSQTWRRIRRKWKIPTIKISVIFYSWMSFMGIPSKRLPKKLTIRIIVLLWIWYCFIIRSLYQGVLITALKAQIRYPQVKSLHEGIEAGYGYGAGKSIIYYYRDEPDILKNWVVLNPKFIKEVMFDLSNGWKFLVAFDEEMIIHFNKENHGEREIKIIQDPITFIPTLIYFKKYSPFAQPINEILLKLIESGFVEKFYRDYTSTYKSIEKPNEPITLEDYTGCFIVLVIGYIVSIISFLLELYKLI